MPRPSRPDDAEHDANVPVPEWALAAAKQIAQYINITGGGTADNIASIIAACAPSPAASGGEAVAELLQAVKDWDDKRDAWDKHVVKGQGAMKWGSYLRESERLQIAYHNSVDRLAAAVRAMGEGEKP